MPDPQEQVAEFHRIYGLPDRRPLPRWPKSSEIKMRLSLIEEELQELKDAVDGADLCDVMDALGDLVYVCYGMALHFGVNLQTVIDEIHRSNLTKLDTDGSVIRREDGKILKGPNYEPPDIAGVLW